MAVERCNSCGRLVDLDWHVEEIEYKNGVPICIWCAEDDEETEEEPKMTDETKVEPLKSEVTMPKEIHYVDLTTHFTIKDFETVMPLLDDACQIIFEASEGLESNKTEAKEWQSRYDDFMIGLMYRTTAVRRK